MLQAPKNPHKQTSFVTVCLFLLLAVIGPHSTFGQHLTDDHSKHADRPEGPVITIRGKGVKVNNGDTITKRVNNTAFGQVEVFGSIPKHRFTITNTGDEILQMRNPGTIQLKGTDTLTFRVEEQPDSRLGPGDSTSFLIQFDPDTQKLQTATVEIRSNDSSRTPYTFRINGEGVRSTNNAFTPKKEAPLKIFQGKKGHIQVSFQRNTPNDRFLRLYNTKGQMVRSDRLRQGQSKIKMSTDELSSGLYILQGSSNRGLYTKKIGIQ